MNTKISEKIQAEIKMKTPLKFWDSTIRKTITLQYSTAF